MFLYCDIEPGKLNHPCELISDYGDIALAIPKAQLDELPQLISEYCKKQDIAEVRLGGLHDLATGIAWEIEAYNLTNYGENKLNVEVI